MGSDHAQIDHADWSANHVGIIGDSADKRYTFVRLDGKAGDPTPPESFYIADWKQGWSLIAPLDEHHAPAKGLA